MCYFVIMKHVAKKDKYSRARGGNSVFYSLLCANCGEFLLVYQKDGIGSMVRLYADRISGAFDMKKIQQSKQKSDLPVLKCGKCGLVVGVPIVYEPENRLAFRLVRGTFKRNRYET
ncbi:MAG: hypothetical protein ACD_56C00004G0002 [uncultured bacterium]|nr:MAG: hypothetical protein ACD_56C00004G0002 [uncultured bacterium]